MSRRRPLFVAVPALLALALAGCPGSGSSPGGDGGDGGDAASQPAGSDGASTAADAAPDATDEPAEEEKEPFDEETAQTAWADAKVGDWAVYENHRRDMTTRFEVTAVDDESVTFVRSNAETGEKLGEPVTYDLAECEERWQEPSGLDGLDGEPTRKTIEVDGEPLECLVVKRQYGGSSTESWLRKDMTPFMEVVGWALVKSIKDGELMYELLRYGEGGSAGGGSSSD